MHARAFPPIHTRVSPKSICSCCPGAVSNRVVACVRAFNSRRQHCTRSPYPSAIAASRTEGLLPRAPTHHVTKHLQQGIESDHFRVKRAMPRVGGFRSFHNARRTICGFEAMLRLRKGFSFTGAWTVREQNQLLGICFGLSAANKA